MMGVQKELLFMPFIYLAFLHVTASCLNSGLGNLQIAAAYVILRCRGTEHTLQDCTNHNADQCMQSVGVHCSK